MASKILTMRILKKKYMHLLRLLIAAFLPFIITACEEPGEEWNISVGKGGEKQVILVDESEPTEVKVCLDKKGGSGYPISVVAQFDNDKYPGMLEGQCMYFKGKKVVLRFGTPSSGKFAKGTYEIIAAKQ